MVNYKLSFDNVNVQLSNLLNNMHYHVPTNVGPIAVDIGTNVGSFIIKHYQSFRTIFGFEPVYRTHTQCLKNLQERDIINSYVHNLGISCNGQIIKLGQHFRHRPGDVTSSETKTAELYNANYDHSDTNCEFSATIRFEDICKFCKIDRINYLKFDCEGCEDTLLGQNLNNIDYIGIEIHDGLEEVKDYILQKFVLIHQGSPHEFTYRNKLLL